MIKDSYPLIPTKLKNAFFFKSVGVKGTILKVIIFEHLKGNRYNLAFGDVVNNELDDEVISNNRDFVKVMATVATAIYYFLETNPKAIVEIDPIDSKRALFYNRIFQRKHTEIIEILNLVGIVNKQKEIYNPEKLYDKFEIRSKKA